ncbi:hypothetical protein [Streptomyces boncukensis]|uniref:Uncharacterized protein n=1 Tax=Streptomyces boncukensis TaxID=2711219 RepID=A0A6G4WUA1_9ACTN|nr:hypothetical protein [Streptomyces boncukensis]NGO68210.1 hypothetical protein [Streptomyces boncukensis]
MPGVYRPDRAGTPAVRAGPPAATGHGGDSRHSGHSGHSGLTGADQKEA